MDFVVCVSFSKVIAFYATSNIDFNACFGFHKFDWKAVTLT